MREKRTFDKKKMKVRPLQVRLDQTDMQLLQELSKILGYEFRSVTARVAIKQFISNNKEVLQGN